MGFIFSLMSSPIVTGWMILHSSNQIIFANTIQMKTQLWFYFYDITVFPKYQRQPWQFILWSNSKWNADFEHMKNFDS